MKSLGSPPRVSTLHSVATEDWFSIASERLKVYSGTTLPTAASLPQGQWAIFFNTATKVLQVIVNYGGVVYTAPPTAVAFRASLSAPQSITPTTLTKIALNSATYDPTSCFDAVNHRFVPQVPGYYQLNGTFSGQGTSMSALVLNIMKNGVSTSSNTMQLTISLATSLSLGDIVYMNGTTDYVELWGQVNCSSAAQFNSGSALTYLSGTLIAKA